MIAHALAWVWATIRRNPVTLSVLLITIAVAIPGRGLRGPSLAMQFVFGSGYHQIIDAHRWWTPITSMFLTTGGLELPFVLVAIVFGIGAAERRMRPLRTLLAFVVTPIAGVVIGVTLQAVGSLTGEMWTRRVNELVSLDPMTAVFGVVMTASAFTGPIWRRRLRVLLLAVAAVFLLYSGHPSDLYRMLAALAGFALGYLLRPSESTAWWPRSSDHEIRVLLSTLVAVTAIGPSITIFSRLRLGPLSPLGLLLTDARPTGLRVAECQAVQGVQGCIRDVAYHRIDGVGPILLTVLPLLTLLVASFALARGRRFGVWLTVVVNVVLAALAAFFYGFLPVAGSSVVVQMRTPHEFEQFLSLLISILVPLAIAAIVLVNVRHFPVIASRNAARLYLSSVVIAFAALSTTYIWLGWLLRDRFSPSVDYIQLVEDLPDRFVPIGFLRLEALTFLPTDMATRILYYWVGPTFWLVVIVGAFLMTLARLSRNYVEGLPRVRALLRAGGSASLCYQATWAGNSYWFSPDGRAAVAYRLLNGVALTVTDPIGKPAAAAAAVEQFARFCDDNGWIPVFYSVHEPILAKTKEMGWQSMPVAEETVVRPQEWATVGKQWQDIRTAISRAEREGITSVWTNYESLTLAHANQIKEISELWVAERDMPEMGFNLGGLAELRDPEVGLMLALDQDDHVVGVTSWLPSYGRGHVVGWTLDFMRRAPDAMPGLMEFLIARAAERFRDTGIAFMSLSGAPLVRLETTAPNSTDRLLGFISARLEPVYGFQSLFNFKRKFQPEFHTMSMAYADRFTLPTIALALSRAYVPSMSGRQAIRFMRNLG